LAVGPEASRSDAALEGACSRRVEVGATRGRSPADFAALRGDGNGVGDADDIAQQLSDDLHQNGIPDECEALIFADGLELGIPGAW
jgi:hypothetical protein